MSLINLRNCTIMFRNFNIILLSLILGTFIYIPVFGEDFALLSGRVMNMELEPVVKARVKVTGRRGHAYTDKNGYFELANIPFGPSEIVVTAPGYNVDKTTVSIYQPFVEFTTTLHRVEIKPEVEMKRSHVDEPIFGNIYGVCGRIELPNLSVYPKGSYNVNFNLFRSKNTNDRYSNQSLSYLALGGQLTDKLELSLFSREDFKRSESEADFFKKIGEEVPLFEDLSGVQLKHVGKFKFGGKETDIALGGVFLARNYLDISSEIYLAINIPFLEGETLTLVPIYNSGCNKVTYNFSFEKDLSLDERFRTSFIFEAIQNGDRKYRRFNTGFRFIKGRNSLNLYYMSDTDYNLRTYGIGTSVFFK